MVAEGGAAWNTAEESEQLLEPVFIFFKACAVLKANVTVGIADGSKVNGAAKAKAQGQATIKTAVKTFKALETSIKSQIAAETNAITNKFFVKR